ncbi:ASCH domain-containing protein [Pedobacter sp. Leaf170]|uniref:ASCH domain-containing protein n=1 Tax=Pedobacter sp. Leaf170 TaxID=2876558 RepID=UPI001E590C6D|nr:ASCH domain-containing protein [Pedobacter sp. Leaf170]
MKALTIKQPWASLIAHGIKDIENRSWRTKYRGRIFIHAASKPVGNDLETILNYKQYNNIPLDKQLTFNNGIWQNGAIIGEVDIVDCVLNNESIWAEQMAYDVCPDTGIHILRKGQPYIWNWVLANAVIYEQPILNVKGALSLWNYEKPYQVIGTAEMIISPFEPSPTDEQKQWSQDFNSQDQF